MVGGVGEERWIMGLWGCNSFCCCFFDCFFLGGGGKVIVEFAPLVFFFICSFLVLRAFCCLFFLFFGWWKRGGGGVGGGWEYGFSFFLALRGGFDGFDSSGFYGFGSLSYTPSIFYFSFLFLPFRGLYRLPFFFPSSSFSLVSAPFFAPTPSRPNLSTSLFTFSPKS